jgi:LPS sulfotransferase NodH
MYSQALAYPEIVPYLMRRRIRVVHLVRRNHLDVLISFELKRAIGKAHILSPNDRPRNLAVEIDTTSLLRDLRRLQLKHSVGRHVLRLSGLRHIEVAYEDLVTDPTRFADVLEFLSIQPPNALPRSNILKSRGGSQREAVSNYDAVRRVLERSDFAGLLE